MVQGVLYQKSFMNLLIDVGGSKTRVALSNDLVMSEKVQIIDTLKNYEDFLKYLKNFVDDIGKKVNSVCCGVPGVIDKKNGKIFKLPHLSDWSGKKLGHDLEEITGSRVYLENDAALVGLGEAVKGAGKGFDIVAYITVSTGVGGALIVDGEIPKRSVGFEPGHQIIDIYGGPGHSMYLEQFVSGSGIEESLGKSPVTINDKAFWEEKERIIALGLNNIAALWSPEVIILGGGIIESGKVSLKAIKKYLKEYLTIFPEIPEIKESSLGKLGGIEGGKVYLRQKLGKDIN